MTSSILYVQECIRLECAYVESANMGRQDNTYQETVLIGNGSFYRFPIKKCFFLKVATIGDLSR